MNQAKAMIIAAIIGAIASLAGTFLTVYQPRLETLTDENTGLEDTIAQLKLENAELREQLPDDIDGTITRLNDQIAKLERENAELREKLNPNEPVIPVGAVAISSASELYSSITANMSGSFYLTQDIDMTDEEDWNDKWAPLGWKSDSDAVPFTGTLDGRGHTIRGVQNEGSSFGLFQILSGTVRNLHIDVQFNYGDYGNGGALAVSMTKGGIIENCYASGKINSGDYSTIGSFVGEADKGSMSNCFSAVSLNIGDYFCNVGGMIGKASGVKVTNCLFKGEIYRGRHADSSGVIAQASDDCEIKSCHYYYGETHSEVLARLKQKVTYTDWDWTVWAIDSDVNDGFPYLRMFEAEFQKA